MLFKKEIIMITLYLHLSHRSVIIVMKYLLENCSTAAARKVFALLMLHNSCGWCGSMYTCVQPEWFERDVLKIFIKIFNFIIYFKLNFIYSSNRFDLLIFKKLF